MRGIVNFVPTKSLHGHKLQSSVGLTVSWGLFSPTSLDGWLEVGPTSIFEFCSCCFAFVFVFVLSFVSSTLFMFITVLYCSVSSSSSFFLAHWSAAVHGASGLLQICTEILVCSVVTLRNKISLRSMFLVLTGFHLIGFLHFQASILRIRGFFFFFLNMKIVIILLKFEVILVLFFQVLKFELLLLTLTVVGI